MTYDRKFPFINDVVAEKKKKKKEEGGGGAHHCQASRIQGIYRLP